MPQTVRRRPQAIAGQGGRARFIQTDVGDAGQAQRLVDQTLAGVRPPRRPDQQRRHHQDRGFPGDQRGRFRRRAAGQPEGRVPGRPGGGARHGQAGQGRDRQHVVDQRRGRDRQPGALRDQQGRGEPADQGHGAGARRQGRAGQRDRPRLDPDRPPEGGDERRRGAPADPVAHADGPLRRARPRSPRSPCSWQATTPATHRPDASTPTAAASRSTTPCPCRTEARRTTARAT